MYAFAVDGSYVPICLPKYQVDVLPNGALLTRIAWPEGCGLHCCVCVIRVHEYLRTFETRIVPQMFAGSTIPFLCPVFVQGSITSHVLASCSSVIVCVGIRILVYVLVGTSTHSHVVQNLIIRME
jgi:hypothetical protein